MQKNQKRPQRAFRNITFDREKIRASIEHLTYNEAARLKGPIFKALEDEMYREGCHMLPELLRCIAEKEQMLFDAMTIRNRISDMINRSLLTAIVEKLKDGELAVVKYKDCGNKQFFTQFYEAIELLEPYKTEFEYVLTSLLEKLISICHNVDENDPNTAEIVSRIYFMYSEHLINEGKLAGGIAYLEKVLRVCRGKSWLANRKRKSGMLLHEQVVLKLSNEMLNYGHQIMRTDPEEANELARKATLVTAEFGRARNMVLFCTTFLDRVLFLMEDGKYKEAKQTLNKIRSDILKFPDVTFVKINIKFYDYEAKINSFYEHYEAAIKCFQRALRLCRIYDHRLPEAEILLSLGKIYARDNKMTSIAKDCYERAKRIFIDFRDQQGKKKAVYLLAKLKADEITPLYMDMLKNSDKYYCAFYNLRQWKNCCRPFWPKLGTELVRQEREPIYCLLNEEREGSEKEAKSIQDTLEQDIKFKPFEEVKQEDTEELVKPEERVKPEESVDDVNN